jgi:hypothetical protein
MNAKMVLTALGLATLVATPALAQKQAHRGQLQAPYASANTVTPGVVSSDGHLIGTDPDPSIRSELARDATTYTSSN